MIERKDAKSHPVLNDATDLSTAILKRIIEDPTAAPNYKQAAQMALDRRDPQRNDGAEK
jgi:hypothetical protein